MKKIILRTILYLCRTIGLFKLARHLTRHQLRILAYHGIAMRDEHKFRGGLFMAPETFETRMQLLYDQGFPVLSLSEAMALRVKDQLPAGSTVITIDDGWVGTWCYMAPVLEKHGFKSTLYLSSYYMEKGTQVFRVAVDYVLWSSTLSVLPVEKIGPVHTGKVNINCAVSRLRLAEQLSQYANELSSAEQAQALLATVCEYSGVDYDEIVERRICAYMSRDEARELAGMGMDIQLHTHRHRTPTSRNAFNEEIEDNRKSLSSLSRSPLVHHCYPSGEYEKHQIPWLQQLGVESATTVKPGFNCSHTDQYQLRRFLDWDEISLIEFEAEMSGILQLCRNMGIRI